MPLAPFPPRGSLAREPQPGDVYEFTLDSHSIAGHDFPKGTRLTLIAETDDAPYGFHERGVWVPFKDPAGNWLVDGPNGRTVWSSIRHGIQTGHLKLVMQLNVNGFDKDRPSRLRRIDKDIL